MTTNQMTTNHLINQKWCSYSHKLYTNLLTPNQLKLAIKLFKT